MAALASHNIGVVVQLRTLFMGSFSMARHTGDAAYLIVVDQAFIFSEGRGLIAASGNKMGLGCMAADTVKATSLVNYYQKDVSQSRNLSTCE